VQQHLDTPTLIAVLKLLFPRASTLLDTMCIVHLLRDQQAVAQQMEGAALVEVLHAAVKSRADIARCAASLFELPKVQQLGAAVVLELLRAAVGRFGSDEDNADLFCSLPAAQQLSSDGIVLRLLAAIEARDTQMVRALLHLPAAQLLSTGDAVWLLLAAVEQAISRWCAPCFTSQLPGSCVIAISCVCCVWLRRVQMTVCCRCVVC
jgi:hypothetical protein